MGDKKILVTGGAGYIGSVVTANLLKNGYKVVVLDDLSVGKIDTIERLKRNFSDGENFEFVKNDLSDISEIEQILKTRNIEAVMHFAAKVSVKEAMKFPELYFEYNLNRGVNLVEAMTAVGVNKLVFSSTAAVYGNPEYVPTDEKHPVSPTSPYGESKLDFEKYLDKTNNLNYIIFRYFNVAGASIDGLFGRRPENDDFISVVQKVALGEIEKIYINGGDYKTKDGTTVRDFVHVEDISSAHILALKELEKIDSKNIRETYNLGSGKDYTLKEIIKKVEEVTSKKIDFEMGPRLPGDVEVSRANIDKVKTKIGWEPKHSDLETVISTDWAWRNRTK